MSPSNNKNAGKQNNVKTATQQQILATVRNQFGAAEGSLLPPRQIGQNRVPIVTNLKIGNVTSFVGGTQFTLTFQEPVTTQNNPIDHYNIYVAGVNGNLSQLNGPNTCLHSPATVRVSTVVAEPVIFYVQTVLTNGMTSTILTSPTCTSTTVAGQVTSSDIPPGTIGIAQLAPETAGSLITFSNTQVPTLISPVAQGSLLASNGVGTPPVYFAPGTVGQILSTQGAGSPPLWINPVSLLFTSTADVTVANTVTPTSLVGTGVGSMTLPSNFFAIGRTLILKAKGYISSIASTIDIQIKAGSTVLLDTSVVTTPGSTNTGVEIEALITGRTTGVTGTVTGQGKFVDFANYPMVNTAPITLNTTTTQLVDVICTWGTANVGNTLTITNLYLEVLN